MNKIKLKAYAKINIGLDVIRRREDGYHEVKMIMQNIDIYDVLTMKIIEEDKIILDISGSDLPNDRSNLIYKAIEYMKNEYNITKGISATLKKNIPIAAGMAGGSSDCAAALIGMNELFELNINKKELCKHGKKLGADVPYCIIGGTALSEGIGEILTRIKTPPECYVVIAKPNISVSTKFVYENLELDKLKKHPDIDGMIDAIDNGDLIGITDKMENVLETVTIKKYPVIEEIKRIMIASGALNALMSGSGPTVFAIYASEEKARETVDLLETKDYINICKVTKFTNGEQF